MSATNATHVGLAFGDVTVMLALQSEDPSRIERQNFYVIMRDVTTFHERLQQVIRGDPEPLVESDYGMRDFSLRDPWGHLLTFGGEPDPPGPVRSTGSC